MRSVLLLALSIPLFAAAQEAPRLDVDASVWRTSIRGELQSGFLPVDLRQDLALGDRTQFFGRAMLRVGRKHRIVIEGAPLEFRGNNVLSRTINYNGRTYLVQDTVASDASLTYFFAGYQWDFLSRSRGHLGLRGGGAYLGASGAITSGTTGISAARDYTIGLPLLGAEGEVFLIPRILEVHGDIQGMTLGGYGRYVQGSVGGGVHFGPVGFRAGWRGIDADVHERGDANADLAGVAPRISGPVFSVVLRVP